MAETETVLDELKRYVGFDANDEDGLRRLHAHAAPLLPQVAETFYDRILAHPEARQALQGESRIGHLKVTLVGWMDQLLRGPWDDGYWESRLRIGRVHVRIGLPQHYMFGAMNVVRTELARVAFEAFGAEPARLHQVRTALGKILDLELGIMLHTYRDDLLAQQARTERLSTFGQLVGSIAHELRNPLGVIESSVHLLRGRVGEDPRAHKHVERISEQVAAANAIISNLLDMIRNRPLAREPVRLAGVIEGAAASVQRPPEVALALEGLEGLPGVEGDPVQLRQVFANLIQNAVHATAPRGEVRVRGRSEGGRVTLEVEDNGPGVSPATRRRLFEPLITTKENGVGLGLALVKRIAERHGGSVEYADRPGGGARFTVHLPG
jgi:two-component system, NtrC family, sensor histidine kinase HydH